MPRPESASVGWTMQALELLAFQPLSAPQVAAAPVFLPDGDPMATLPAVTTGDGPALAEMTGPVVEQAAALARPLEAPDA